MTENYQSIPRLEESKNMKSPLKNKNSLRPENIVQSSEKPITSRSINAFSKIKQRDSSPMTSRSLSPGGLALIQKYRKHYNIDEETQSNNSKFMNRSLSQHKIEKIQDIVMVQKAQHELSKKSGSAGKLSLNSFRSDRFKFNKDKSPSRTPQSKSPLKLEQLQKSPEPLKLDNFNPVFEFDKSGNEQTFYFKEFLAPESSKLPEIEQDLKNLKNDFWGLAPPESPKFFDRSNPFDIAKSPNLPKYQKVHQSLEKQAIPTINSTRTKDSIDNFIDGFQSKLKIKNVLLPPKKLKLKKGTNNMEKITKLHRSQSGMEIQENMESLKTKNVKMQQINNQLKLNRSQNNLLCTSLNVSEIEDPKVELLKLLKEKEQKLEKIQPKIDQLKIYFVRNLMQKKLKKALTQWRQVKNQMKNKEKSIKQIFNLLNQKMLKKGIQNLNTFKTKTDQQNYQRIFAVQQLFCILQKKTSQISAICFQNLKQKQFQILVNILKNKKRNLIIIAFQKWRQNNKKLVKLTKIYRKMTLKNYINLWSIEIKKSQKLKQIFQKTAKKKCTAFLKLYKNMKNKQIYQQILEIKKLQSQIKNLTGSNEKIDELEQENQGLKKHLKLVKQQNEEANGQIEEIQSQLKQKIKQFESQIFELEENLSIEKSEKQTLQMQLDQQLNQIKKYESMKGQMENLQFEKEQNYIQQIDEMREKIKQNDSNIERIQIKNAQNLENVMNKSAQNIENIQQQNEIKIEKLQQNIENLKYSNENEIEELKSKHQQNLEKIKNSNESKIEKIREQNEQNVQEVKEQTQNQLKSLTLQNQNLLSQIQNYEISQNQLYISEQNFQEQLDSKSSEIKLYISQLEQKQLQNADLSQKIQNLTQILESQKQQINEKEQFFKQKIQEMEQQVKQFIQSDHQVNQAKIEGIKQNHAQEISEMQQKITSQENLIKKQKQQTDEIMKEIIQITTQEQSRIQEQKNMALKMKKIQTENMELKEEFEKLDSEKEKIKSDCANVLKQQKQENIKVIEALEQEFKVIHREKVNLEKELMGKLTENQKISDEKNNWSQENENLKKEMFMIEKYVKKLDEDISEQKDVNERQSKEIEIVKKKYNEAKLEAQTAYKGLENYQVILTKFENNLQNALKSKESAEMERDKALNEIRVVRQRYISIVGIEQFQKDFGN